MGKHGLVADLCAPLPMGKLGLLGAVSSIVYGNTGSANIPVYFVAYGKAGSLSGPLGLVSYTKAGPTKGYICSVTYGIAWSTNEFLLLTE